VLVRAVLGGACALPAPAPFAYMQVLAEAVDSYNQRPEVQNAFRLLSAEPEPAPKVGHGGPGALPRVTPRVPVSPQVIKECSGPVQLLQSSPEIDLRCSDASSD
ncbi:CTHL2 protein, partial [Oriolus oriolus]|nr:CTHL2 protein [Oriolus oriolus]